MEMYSLNITVSEDADPKEVADLVSDLSRAGVSPESDYLLMPGIHEILCEIDLAYASMIRKTAWKSLTWI